MYSDGMKFVNFDEYCDSCVNKDEKEECDACDECLSNPTNLYSHKPVNWKGND